MGTKQGKQQSMQEEKIIQTEAETAPLTPVKDKKPSKKLRVALGALIFLVVASAAGFVGAAVYDQFGGSSNAVLTRDKVVMQEGEAVAEVAKKVSPSVVSIVTSQTAQTLFGYNVQQEGAGTGIIISKDGYVITNKHVVSDTTNSVQIVAADGTQYKSVKFVGADPTNDIAFLKIEGVDNLTPVELGDSSQMQVGQKVVAIGNALGEYQNTVTTGIISALSRPVTASDGQNSTETLDDLLQTDAAINPGNSGGPLVNLAGEVIGINTAVVTDAEGIGFAIPVNDVKGMVKTLLATGKVVKPFVGVRYVPVTAAIAKEMNLSVKNGALIYSGDGTTPIVSGSPAEKAGLRDKDIIVKVDNTHIDSTHPFASVIAQYSPGDVIKITYIRDGKESTVSLTVSQS